MKLQKEWRFVKVILMFFFFELTKKQKQKQKRNKKLRDDDYIIWLFLKIQKPYYWLANNNNTNNNGIMLMKWAKQKQRMYLWILNRLRIYCLWIVFVEYQMTTPWFFAFSTVRCVFRLKFYIFWSNLIAVT